MALSRRAALGLLALTAFAPIVRAEPRVLVDSVGRRVNAPDKVNRVLAAGPPASILLYALAPDAMIGWVPALPDAARPFVLPSVRELPPTERMTSRGQTPDAEKIKALKPDLIVDFGSIGGSYVELAEKVQADTKVPYALIDGGLDRLQTSLRLVGDFLGRRERAEALARYAEQTRARLDAALPKAPPDRRPKVYVARGPDGLQSAVKGSALTEVVERAGGINVAEGKPGRGGAVDVTQAQIAAWKPDFVIALDKGAYEAMRKPGASGSAHVLAAPTSPWNWLGEPPSINRLMGLRWLSAMFYPPQGKIDLPSEAKEFHRLFYGTTLGDADLARLLEGAS